MLILKFLQRNPEYRIHTYYTVTNSENVDISGNITVTDNRTGQISISNTNLPQVKALKEQLPM